MFLLSAFGLVFAGYGDPSYATLDLSAFSFEDGLQGWQPSQAVYEVAQDSMNAFLGKGSLKAFVNLVPGDPNKEKGEVWVDLRTNPPARQNFQLFYDFSKAIVTVAIWVPREAVGNPKSPNGLHFFFKDDQGRAKYSRWISFAEIPTDTWYQVVLDVENELWSWDDGANLRNVAVVGIKIAASGEPEAKGFTGAIWLDAFDWVLPSPLFRGISYTSWSAEEYATSASDSSLFRIKFIRANYVALIPTWYMDTFNAVEIYADRVRTPSDSSLAHAIQTAHSYGLGVMLKPHLDVKDGTWRGEIAPQDIRIWFEKYKTFILHYARLAQEYEVELFCVGTELRSLSGPEFRVYWEEMIAAVRSTCTSRLVYAANWDEYTSVSFWDLLDYVGVDAYFPLSFSKTPSVAELVQAWGSWISALENWQKQVSKPVIFTEIGYRSIDYTAKEPWDWTSTAPYNPEAQANAYQAVLQAFEGKPWFAGLFFWNWLPDPNAGGPGDLDYTPQNKPAQEVLARFFGQMYVVIADFEEGSNQGWEKVPWKGPFFAAPMSSDALAYHGRWSLAIPLALDGRIDDAVSLVKNLNFSPYDTLVVHLFVPADAPISWIGGVVFVKVGPEWTWYQGEWQNFQPGSWHKLTINLQGIPHLDFVREIGLLVVGEGRGKTTIYIDYIGLEKRELKADKLPPSPPSGVEAYPVHGSKILVVWRNPTDPDFSHARVYRSSSIGELGEIVFDKVTEEFVLDDAVEIGKTYYYTVRSVDLVGNESENVGQVEAVSQPIFNLALGKSVEASSNEEHSPWYQGEPGHVCDGDLRTRWSSIYSDPQWIIVDLESVYEIGRVNIFWETAYAKVYEVQVSLDGTIWRTVYSMTNGDGGVNVAIFPKTTARYVRLFGRTRGTSWGYSVWELEVYEY